LHDDPQLIDRQAFPSKNARGFAGVFICAAKARNFASDNSFSRFAL
jgi:hypothetical protein